MFGLTALGLARIQFGFTMSSHIIFPAITIGLASYLVALEGLWLWKLAVSTNPAVKLSNTAISNFFMAHDPGWVRWFCEAVCVAQKDRGHPAHAFCAAVSTRKDSVPRRP